MTQQISFYDKSQTDALLGEKADTDDLATVAFTGDYDDLTDKPILATVATTGDYDDLIDKPTLATVATTGDYDDLIDKPTLATVATSGDYDDLLNKPIIPPGAILYDATGQNTDGAITQKATTDALNGKVDVMTVQGGTWLYAQNVSGQTNMRTTDDNVNGTIPYRSWSNGTIRVGSPVQNDDAATKKYVDDGLAAKATITDFVLLDPSVPKRMNVRTSGSYNGNTYVYLMFQYQQNGSWVDLWNGSGQFINDTAPTANSGYYITSGRIYDALQLKQDKITVTDNTTYITLNY